MRRIRYSAVMILLDASTIINLVNGEIFDVILGIEGVEFQVSGSVKDESSSVAEMVNLAIAKGALSLADDSLISYSKFSAAKDEMRLGDGETECILIALAVHSHFACDDLRARKKAIKYLGEESLVTGSLGLMKRACTQGLISTEDAQSAYEQMLKMGGFLPEIEPAYFANEMILSNGFGA